MRLGVIVREDVLNRNFVEQFVDGVFKDVAEDSFVGRFHLPEDFPPVLIDELVHRPGEGSVSSEEILKIDGHFLRLEGELNFVVPFVEGSVS